MSNFKKCMILSGKAYLEMRFKKEQRQKIYKTKKSYLRVSIHFNAASILLNVLDGEFILTK